MRIASSLTTAPPERGFWLTIEGFLPEVACDEFARLARCFDLSVISQGPPSLGRILPQSDDVGAASRLRDESAASYMVMGAYGHWRLKELVLGGVTRRVITSTTTRAFMVQNQAKIGCAE